MSPYAMATIVDGVRQKPTYETTGFVTDTEMYLYNVGAGQFFTQGNSWGTQASVGETGLPVRFTSTGNGDYYLQDYRNGSWYYTFFDSETALFVDRNNQANYYFSIEDNGSTFRLSTSSRNPTFGDYAGAGLYVGLTKNSSSTALQPFVDEDEAYVDWALVSTASYNSLAAAIEIYNKAQELKTVIDKINAVNGDASSLEAVYLNEDATLSEIQEAIDASKLIYVNALITNAPDKNNVDVTMLLNNPKYEENTNGWTVNAASGGNVAVAGLPTNKCFEAWNNSNFDIYQNISNAPAGVYEIEVQGFYRYLRDNAAWAAYKAQTVDYVKPQGVPVYVYLNNNATPFKNIYSEPVPKNTLYTTNTSLLYPSALMPCEDDKGNWYPNEMYNSAVAFDAGMYKQSAYGLVAKDGDALRIGVKGKSNQGGDSWVIWDNFTLRYRGFQADVIQPILETAMTDLNQYATMLMGKTEYEQLAQAFSDAESAIAAQDGEAMFNALNALYDVKESVIASKDLFLEQEVPTDLQNLQDAITALTEHKLSAATRTNATLLAAEIAGNLRYEGSEISQLKSDVNDAINALNTSAELYSNLNTAITTLQTAVTAKAQQSLIDEANELLPVVQAGYNEGTIADDDVNTQISTINAKVAAINASAAKYTALNEAIGRLTDAIATASTDEARVAKSTLNKASLRLTASQRIYDEATTGNDDIDARVTAIDQLITELTHSIELYRQFNTALTALQTALATEDKMSAATRTAAQQAYDTALEAYNAGTVDDDQIEAQVNALTAQVTAIENSVAAYTNLGNAYPFLEDVINLKAKQTLVDEANQLYTTASEGYAAGSIADGDIAGMLDDIDAIIPQVEASADAYATLKAAIDRLEAALDEYGDQITKSSLKKANLRLTATKNLYNNGTIADEDIPARVETIDQLIDDMTASIRLRQQYDEAIQNLDIAIAAAQGRVDETMMQNALDLQTTIKNDYNEGNVDDENIQTEIDKINNIIEALNAAVDIYSMSADLDDVINSVEAQWRNASAELDAIKETADESYLTTNCRTNVELNLSSLKEDDLQMFRNWIETDANWKRDTDNDLKTYDLTSGANGLSAIQDSYSAIQSELLDDIALQIDGVVAAGHSSLEENLAKSSRIVEMKGEFATFCSTADLDFTNVEGLKAYVATAFDADGMMVKMTQVTNVPAGTGIMVVAEGADDTLTEYTIDSGSSTADFTDNLLVGNPSKSLVTATDGDKTNLILANGNEGIAFYALAGGTLAAGKAYLQLPTSALSAGVKGIAFEFENLPTDIQQLQVDVEGDGRWFDLTGKQLGRRPLKAGVYIHNGQKVVIK